MKKRNLVNILIYILIPVLVFAVFYAINNKDKIKKESPEYTELVGMVLGNQIEEMNINLSNGRVKYKLRDSGEEHFCKVASPNFFHEDINDFIIKHNQQSKDKITVSYVRSVNLWSYIPTFLGLLMLVLIFGFFKKTAANMPNAKAQEFGNSKIVSEKDGGITFKNVAGCNEEKEELEEVVQFLKNPKAFLEAGARIPKGVLLIGPPGTGKTLIAKAVAGEAGVPFYSISGSDFVEMYVGVGASRVRNLFEIAKKNSPSIVFIDEIDAVGRQRGVGTGGGNDEREQTLNQLLVELDGFKKNQNVIVMAATNRPDVLDKALLRPGRFDRRVIINLPDMVGREEILRIYAANKKIDESVNLKTIAANTVGYCGADLENLLNEAALMSVRAGRKVITEKDIDDAMLKVVMGPEKKSHILSPKDKEITSYHEAGHAIVSYFLKTQAPVQQISIIPRGMAAGFTLYQNQKGESHVSKLKLTEDICAMLGGRAAEEITQESVTTGASSDIKRATELAKKMVTEWGMSSIGPVDFVLSSGSYAGNKSQVGCFSEAMGKQIDSEIHGIIVDEYNAAKNILSKNKASLKEVAEILMKEEKISGEIFREIMVKNAE